MKRLGICLLTLGWLLVLVNPVIAQQLVEGVVTGCKAELEKYCSNVTPGEARVLACLYAHNDKLSGRCEYALYDAAVQLERAVAALTYVANECADDLRKHCARVEAVRAVFSSAFKKTTLQYPAAASRHAKTWV